MNENVIPEFEVACTFAVHAADVVCAAQVVALFAEVNMNFGARAAGTELCHLPEVFLAPEEQNMLGVEAGLFLPDVRGFIILWDITFIVTEAGGVEFIFGKSPHFGEQLPRPGDGVFFVVVTE